MAGDAPAGLTMQRSFIEPIFASESLEAFGVPAALQPRFKQDYRDCGRARRCQTVPLGKIEA
jgi:hypothetical protein